MLMIPSPRICSRSAPISVRSAADLAVLFFQDHEVVGNKLMTAEHQIKGRLALADRAFPDDERAEIKDPHQHAMKTDPRR